MSNLITGLLVEKGNEKKFEEINRINSSSPDNFSNINIMKKFNLFGENFSVLGTQQGNVGIINQKLEAKSIKVANVIII